MDEPSRESLPSYAAVVGAWRASVLPPPCQPVSNLLGNAAIPVELWAMVFVGALRVVGGSDVIARIVWRSGEAPARR